jgi:hypothetical protein
VLVTAEDLPAQVVVRDGSGTVVHEQEAAPAAEEQGAGEAGPQAVVLEEGVHRVECRPGDGAATAVELRVAWPAPGAVQREQSVTLRVFDGEQR